MNISFDLDSTLIPNGEEFDTEKQNRFANFLGIELIRKGTPELINYLQNQGFVINIYTTSFRPKSKIRRTLKYYNIKVNRIVNQSENLKVLKSKNINASKYPRAFNFDIHIDDSIGVRLEGEKYNFQTIIVDPSERNWIDHIKNELQILHKK